ncbi:MAG: GspH/FimT family pseudopilin [Parashewanella sp.]
MSKGFTLAELMIAFAITVILLTVGAPSLTNLYHTTRAEHAIKKIHQALVLTRSHAVSLGQRVVACPLENNKCINNWQQGISVFTDTNNDQQVNGDDVLLYSTGPFNSDDFVTYNQQNVISFRADGISASGAGTLSYCPNNKQHQASKAISINMAGRIRYKTDTVIDCL